MKRRQPALGRARHQRHLPETELAGQTAACSALPVLWPSVLASEPFLLISRFFHDHERIVINFFHFLHRRLAVRKRL